MTHESLRVRVVSLDVIDRTEGGPIVPRSSGFTRTRALEQVDGSLDEVLYGTSGVNPHWRDEILPYLKRRADERGVTYAVPGDPLTGDATVRQLLALDAAGEVTVTIERSTSHGALTRVLPDLPEPCLYIDQLTLLESNAGSPFAGGSHPLSSNQTTIVTNVEPAHRASVRAVLERHYGPKAPTCQLSSENPEGLESRPLAELDDRSVADMLVIPSATGDRFYRTGDDLQRLVARLRAPQGCPWDREQTNESLSRNLIEESYELLEAIESGDVDEMREEMGDFLLQAFLHSQIAEEAERFTLEDVFDTVITKLVRRHPHVFASVSAEGSSDVVRNWDEIKRAERAEKADTDTGRPLGNVPIALPALSRAQTLLKRARRSDMTGESVVRHRDDAAGRAAPGAPESDILRDLLDVVERAATSGVDLEELLRAWTREFEQSIAADGAREPDRTG